jgi:hypothetical protein
MGRVRSIDRTIPAHYRAQSRGIIHKGCAISDVIAFFLIEALLSDYGAGATGLRRLRRLSAKAGTWEQRFPAAQFRKSAAGEANTQKR